MAASQFSKPALIWLAVIALITAALPTIMVKEYAGAGVDIEETGNIIPAPFLIQVVYRGLVFFSLVLFLNAGLFVYRTIRRQRTSRSKSI